MFQQIIDHLQYLIADCLTKKTRPIIQVETQFFDPRFVAYLQRRYNINFSCFLECHEFLIGNRIVTENIYEWGHQNQMPPDSFKMKLFQKKEKILTYISRVCHRTKSCKAAPILRIKILRQNVPLIND